MDELIEICGTDAQKAGWWDDFPGDIDAVRHSGSLTPEQHNWIGNKLLLVCSEAIEAHGEIRNGKGIHDYYHSEGGKPEGFATELADVIVRVMDMCYNLNIPLEMAINAKLAYNRRRGYKHGNKVS